MYQELHGETAETKQAMRNESSGAGHWGLWCTAAAVDDYRPQMDAPEHNYRYTNSCIIINKNTQCKIETYDTSCEYYLEVVFEPQKDTDTVSVLTYIRHYYTNYLLSLFPGLKVMNVG